MGRPNVGKSSIVNMLLREDRVLVEPLAGTTMDAIDTEWKTPAGTFTLMDTAGIRRESRYQDEAEFYAVVRALNALQRADVACLVLDATQGFLKQEARLAHNALDAGCALLLIYNKWDLIEGRQEAWKRLTLERTERYPTLADLPAVPVSATEKINLGRLPKLILQRVEEHTRKIPTRALNDWLAAVQKLRGVPSTGGGLIPKLYYIAQTGVRPAPVHLVREPPAAAQRQLPPLPLAAFRGALRLPRHALEDARAQERVARWSRPCCPRRHRLPVRLAALGPVDRTARPRRGRPHAGLRQPRGHERLPLARSRARHPHAPPGHREGCAAGLAAAARLASPRASPAGPEWCRLAVGLAAVAGHVWTFLAGFKGGKGVATTVGRAAGARRRPPSACSSRSSCWRSP